MPKTGRPKAEFNVLRASELRLRGMSLQKIAKEVGVSRSTVYRVLKRLGMIDATRKDQDG